jgi:hypothetical protein
MKGISSPYSSFGAVISMANMPNIIDRPLRLRWVAGQ